MTVNPSPRDIIAALLPYLRVAAGYARHLQTKIKSLPDKDTGDNVFSAALTDADLSIQTLIEVAILGMFPQMRFYGEEYEKSRNTKYFRSLELGAKDDYLITLDPIDGTKLYLDGSDNYLIILSVLNSDEYEAVITVSPANNSYCLALRDRGVYTGDLAQSLDEAIPLKVDRYQPTILLGWDMAALKPTLDAKYHVIDLENSYVPDQNFPNYKNIFAGDLIGWVTKRGKFIDSAALAFMGKEAGYVVTDFLGLPLASLSDCQDYSYSGIIVGVNQEVHQDLFQAIQLSMNNE